MTVRPVRVPRPLLEEMKAHAEECYPEECCGVLIGLAGSPPGGADRTIVEVRRATNEHTGERHRRFLIAPEELRALERTLEGTSWAVVGFYHSHPDHPSRPSQYDQDHAWPWYSYLVLGTTPDGVAEVGAFELDPDSTTFREVPLVSPGPEDRRDVRAARYARA